MKDAEARQELLLRYLDGTLRPEEESQVADLLRSDPEARTFLRDVAEQAVTVADIERVEQGQQLELTTRGYAVRNQHVTADGTGSTRTRLNRWLIGIAAVAIVALTASLYFQRPAAERQIAKIIGLSGSLQWTGDAGQVVRQLSVGTELAGGTIEGIAPDSWFELEFNDGSTVAISGNSMLTFSDHGQKKLHLNKGSFSAFVLPQPAGKPMLIHTRSAMLEVLGTRFDVETGLSSTILNVSEGKVRMKRLSDGSSVVVPAQHRLIVAADREMLPTRVPDSVHRWKSQLHRGSEGTYGKWLPATDQHAARLKGIPLVPPDFPSDTLFMLGLAVSRADSSPVILQPESRFVVRGRIASSAEIYFGIKLAHPNGEFAEKFRAETSATGSNDLRDFEAVFRLSDFELDPCVRDRQDELADNPAGLIVTGVWCFTPYRAGSTEDFRTVFLEVTEVELVPPEENELE